MATLDDHQYSYLEVKLHGLLSPAGQISLRSRFHPSIDEKTNFDVSCSTSSLYMRGGR